MEAKVLLKCTFCQSPVASRRTDERLSEAGSWKEDWSNYRTLVFRLNTGQLLHKGMCVECSLKYQRESEFEKVMIHVKEGWEETLANKMPPAPLVRLCRELREPLKIIRCVRVDTAHRSKEGELKVTEGEMKESVVCEELLKTRSEPYPPHLLELQARIKNDKASQEFLKKLKVTQNAA